jgi:hypothetical protein
MARELAAEYDIPQEELLAGNSEAEEIRPVSPETQVSSNGQSSITKRGRRGQRSIELVEFLREHGPATSQEIIDQTNIPAGTVYRLLRTDQFANDDQHRWKVGK